MAKLVWEKVKDYIAKGQNLYVKGTAIRAKVVSGWIVRVVYPE
jgi:hypothetical protein